MINDKLFLLREGMALRKKHLKMLFGPNVNEYSHPEHIYKTAGGLYMGVNQSIPIIYNAEEFINSCPNVYGLYEMDSKAVIPAAVINKISEDEVVRAFNTGYLKHDSRGYYFDNSPKAMMEVFKCIS